MFGKRCFPAAEAAADRSENGAFLRQRRLRTAWKTTAFLRQRRLRTAWKTTAFLPQRRPRTAQNTIPGTRFHLNGAKNSP